MVRFLASLFLCASLAIPGVVFAETYETQTSGTNIAPRRQVATIVFSGLAGAILGLSTLSFYGRPQEKMLNIAYGAAIGVIIGASYTTYKAATVPRRGYEEGLLELREGPEALAMLDAQRTQAPSSPAIGTGWIWSF